LGPPGVQSVELLHQPGQFGLESLFCRRAFQQFGKLGNLRIHRLVQQFEPLLFNTKCDDLSGEYGNVIDHGADGHGLLPKLIAHVPDLGKIQVAGGKIRRVRRLAGDGRPGKGLVQFLSRQGINSPGVNGPGGGIDAGAFFGQGKRPVGYPAKLFDGLVLRIVRTARKKKNAYCRIKNTFHQDLWSV